MPLNTYYNSAPVGKNKLGSMVSDTAGIPRRTNYSWSNYSFSVQSSRKNYLENNRT
jgi:hypothetical protein